MKLRFIVTIDVAPGYGWPVWARAIRRVLSQQEYPHKLGYWGKRVTVKRIDSERQKEKP